MPKVVGYHRPSSLDEALGLLSNRGSAALAGGTTLNAQRRGEPVVAIDLQALGLEGVVAGPGDTVRIGAMTTLAQLADHPIVPDGLRVMARRELPSTLRTLATVGGTVAAGGTASVLLAGLLVFDAVVTIAGTHSDKESGTTSSTTDIALGAVLADRGQLQGRVIVAVSVAGNGAFHIEATGRTPGDEPIVAACARRGLDGEVRLALAGVAATPLLVDDAASVEPLGDFRGTTEYRRHLAQVLAVRAVEAVS